MILYIDFNNSFNLCSSRASGGDPKAVELMKKHRVVPALAGVILFGFKRSNEHMGSSRACGGDPIISKTLKQHIK